GAAPRHDRGDRLDQHRPLQRTDAQPRRLCLHRVQGPGGERPGVVRQGLGGGPHPHRYRDDSEPGCALRVPAFRHGDPLTMRLKLTRITSEMEEKTADRKVPGTKATGPVVDTKKAKKKRGEKIERTAKRFEVKDVSLYYGDFRAVEGLTMAIEPNQVTALIGSSGCGKTTVLRSLNRMHELVPGARVEGEVILDGENIYGLDIDPVEV